MMAHMPQSKDFHSATSVLLVSTVTKLVAQSSLPNVLLATTAQSQLVTQKCALKVPTHNLTRKVSNTRTSVVIAQLDTTVMMVLLTEPRSAMLVTTATPLLTNLIRMVLSVNQASTALKVPNFQLLALMVFTRAKVLNLKMIALNAAPVTTVYATSIVQL